MLRALIEHSIIDAFMVQYERIKRSRAFIYYSQSIHRAIRPELNEYGFIRESMLNPTRIGLFPRFSDSIKQCIYHEAVTDALTALDGHEQHVSWQDMFFDLSTGTIEHADTWYMDTDPPGSLVGAWFALENIDEGAGTFFVMPGSHRVPPLDKARYRIHEEFRKATLQFVEEHGFMSKGMPIDKGDVILWHPFLVHGGFSNQQIEGSIIGCSGRCDPIAHFRRLRFSPILLGREPIAQALPKARGASIRIGHDEALVGLITVHGGGQQIHRGVICCGQRNSLTAHGIGGSCSPQRER